MYKTYQEKRDSVYIYYESLHNNPLNVYDMLESIINFF